MQTWTKQTWTIIQSSVMRITMQLTSSAYVDTLPISAEHRNELVRLALKVFNAAERNAFLLEEAKSPAKQ